PMAEPGTPWARQSQKRSLPYNALTAYNPLLMSETLVINEIYLSLQGESTLAGLPCVFVRLTACNLRCSYCDTAYAFTEGRKMLMSEVRQEVQRLAKPYDNASAPMRLPIVEL